MEVLMPRTDDFDATKATRERRAQEAASRRLDTGKGLAAFGIQPDSTVLQLEYTSRLLAMELISTINENILRYYVPGGTVEQALWILPVSEAMKLEHEKIKAILAEVFSGWIVTFGNGYGERIILSPRPKIAE